MSSVATEQKIQKRKVRPGCACAVCVDRERDRRSDLPFSLRFPVRSATHGNRAMRSMTTTVFGAS
jgi:hypothetical protein